IKMIQALHHQVLPATLHIDQPSPHIDWSHGTVQLLSQAQPWPVSEHVRTAAVSSFGISGTNAHVIVQQAPDELAVSDTDTTTTPPGESGESAQPTVLVWPLSARSSAALRAQGARLRNTCLSSPRYRCGIWPTAWPPPAAITPTGPRSAPAAPAALTRHART
ncbi:ketoacyl-synthetase C-terminal extension domain-containing protein, partial [Mycobacterium szulgai]|uniref:ketoacyl-synthetase C-terminal extension domain-containing protein n=1 Tax=Mycobacterium szulgai TaxID=1787 RepID=UPI0023E29090